MRSKMENLALAVCVGAASLILACSEVLKTPPPREEVEGLLRQEAAAMKQEGEADVNPALGVEVTWMIESVTVREQPDNETHPFAGTVHFVIESRTQELDETATEQFERTYEYLWDHETDKWLMQ